MMLGKMEQLFEFIEHITDNFLWTLCSGYLLRKAADISCQLKYYWCVNCTIVWNFLDLGLFFLGQKRQIPVSDIFADGVGNNTITPEEILVSVHIPHSRKVSY